ncbi:hypothetical protein KC354_g46 [Hortaea werneckii]|nr:hypothetical protein KC354_g46 [Hortaea werneckii]
MAGELHRSGLLTFSCSPPNQVFCSVRLSKRVLAVDIYNRVQPILIFLFAIYRRKQSSSRVFTTWLLVLQSSPTWRQRKSYSIWGPIIMIGGGTPPAVVGLPLCLLTSMSSRTANLWGCIVIDNTFGKWGLSTG